MVSVLAFVSDDPSSNPAESAVLILSNCLTRTKNQKRGREWPIFKASFTSLILQSLQAVFGWMIFVIWSLRRKVSLLSLFCDATMNKEIASDDRIKRTKAFFYLAWEMEFSTSRVDRRYSPTNVPPHSLSSTLRPFTQRVFYLRPTTGRLRGK